MSISNRRKFLRQSSGLALSTVTSIMFAPKLWAHQKHFSMSTVIWRPDTHYLDVTHRVHIHDAHHALFTSGQIKAQNFYTEASKAQFANLLKTQFGLSVKGQPIPLVTLGAEIEGSFIYVYQQSKLKSVPKSLTLDCKILHDTYPDQRNQVNVKMLETIQSVTFLKGEAPKSIDVK